MSVKRGGLGRNLSALLGASGVSALPLQGEFSTLLLPVSSLHPGKYQPRQAIDQTALQELANSIRQQGLLQPLVVRPIAANNYEIIAGERRWRASQLAGLKDVPVIVREVNDETAMAIALVENLQREDLNPADEARAMARLSEEFGLTHQQIADLVSKSRAAVTNQLRLLNLSPVVLQFLEAGDLDMGHARALLALELDHQVLVADLIIARGLSVRDTEKEVKRLKKGYQSVPNSISQAPRPFLHHQIEIVTKYLQSKVRITQNKKGSGSLIIQYSSVDELETVIQRIIN